MTEYAMSMRTAGLDLGDRYSQVCVLDEDGLVVEESRIRTTEAGVREYFGARGQLRVAVEGGGDALAVGEPIA
jgi:hypothetical protein